LLRSDTFGDPVGSLQLGGEDPSPSGERDATIFMWIMLCWTCCGVLWEVRQMILGGIDAGGAQYDFGPKHDLTKSRLAELGGAWLEARLSGTWIKKVRSGLSDYWSERFNRYDLPAMVFSTLALLSMNDEGIQAFDDRSTYHWARVLRALGACFLWLRLQRVLLASSRVGPYAFMVFVMINDVVSYLMILLFIPIAFAAGLSALLEPNSAKRLTNIEWLPVAQYRHPDCADHFQSFPNALIFLVEHAITGEGFFACAHDSMMPITMWFASFLYVIFAALLLLNMLIAMMAKSFDNVGESRALNYNFLKAQLVIAAAKQPPAPPPFYALSLLYEIYSLFVTGCEVRNTVDFSSLVEGSSTAQAEDAKFITKYIQDNEDDIAVEDRWRTFLKRDMGKAIRKMDTLEKALGGQMESVERDVVDVKEGLEKLLAFQNSMGSKLRRVNQSISATMRGDSVISGAPPVLPMALASSPEPDASTSVLGSAHQEQSTRHQELMESINVNLLVRIEQKLDNLNSHQAHQAKTDRKLEMQQHSRSEERSQDDARFEYMKHRVKALEEQVASLISPKNWAL